jgi:hypothetical protein
MTFMTGLEPLNPDDEFARLSQVVREHNSARIKELLTALEPYVLGLMGPVSPPHVRVYLEALKGLGQLWRVFDRPEPKPDESDEVRQAEVRMAEQQAQVLAELSKLRQIAENRGGDKP